MKAEAASQQQDGVGGGVSSGKAQEPSSQRPLTDEERRVLECLHTAGAGLTKRQIEKRSGCAGEALERAIGSLLESKLATRLNTIIPSYSATVEPPIDGR